MNLCRELLRICVGTADRLSDIPTQKEWEQAFAFAVRHTLMGVFQRAIEQLPQEYRPEGIVAERFLAAAQANAIIAATHERAGREIKEYLSEKGFESCVLKGQGIAQLYPDRESRQSGDVDIWVGGRRDDVIRTLSEEYPVSGILWQECHLEMNGQVGVDIHFYPSKSGNPLHRHRLKKFYESQLLLQSKGLYPSVGFDLIYCMSHIFRHAIRGGVGFKPIMDYYFLLEAASDGEKKEARVQIGRMGMKKIAMDVMYVLKQAFAMPRERLLCEPSNCRRGNRFYRDVIRCVANDRGKRTFRSETELLLRYPGEMLWNPLARLSQFVWKKIKGYN